MKGVLKFLWITALAAAIGFPLAANDGIRKSITITGLGSFNGQYADIWICTGYPWDSDQCVANKFEVEIINGSVTFQLENDANVNRWTGSGSFYIYFDIFERTGDLEFEFVYAPNGTPVRHNINSANTLFTFSNFKDLDEMMY